ncbi:hypothetical protein HCU64_12025 [Methylobacterium sp. C25]|nr:hypothetical protein [Methylobacterium sp. C25]
MDDPEAGGPPGMAGRSARVVSQPWAVEDRAPSMRLAFAQPGRHHGVTLLRRRTTSREHP